jgi:hypothetical protein
MPLLRFATFNTETNFDFVNIYRTDDMTSPDLELHGDTLPTLITGEAGGSLTATYVSDGSILGTGFLATFECTCSLGEFLNPADGLCIACNSGTYAGHAATECTDCPVGQVDADTDPSTACTPCEAGKYTDVVGLEVCVSCDAGTYNVVAGSSSPSDCIACTAGQIDSDNDAATPCEECPAGRYSNEIGVTECSGQCSSHEYSPPGSTDATSCDGCNPSSYDTSQCIYTRVAHGLGMLDAEAICDRAGGNLATIHHDDDVAAILAASGSSATSAWIGLHVQAGTECAIENFIWTDASNSSDYSVPWVGGAADCSDIRPCEDTPDSGEAWDFLVASAWNEFEIWVVGCSDLAPLCQDSVLGEMVQDVCVSTCGVCDDACTRLTIEGQVEVVKCAASPSEFVCQQCGLRPNPARFKSFETRATWEEAEDLCVVDGGHLASIHSEEENSVVYGLMDSWGFIASLGTWIGFHDRHVEAGCTGQGNDPSNYDTGFMWMDGTPVDYTKWHSGEPNDWANGQANCDGTGNEDCVGFVWWTPVPNWNDAECNRRNGFVCGYQTVVAHDAGLPCYVCPAGFHMNDDESAPSCIACASGMFASAGSSSAEDCVACEPGQADADATATTPCTLCAAGTYSAATGATECSGLCPPGSYAAAGSTVESDCVECQAGSADVDGSASTPCVQCDIGQYSSANSALECTSCSVGTSTCPRLSPITVMIHLTGQNVVHGSEISWALDDSPATSYYSLDYSYFFLGLADHGPWTDDPDAAEECELFDCRCDYFSHLVETCERDCRNDGRDRSGLDCELRRTFTYEIDLSIADDHTFRFSDSFGDGWDEAYWELTNSCGETIGGGPEDGRVLNDFAGSGNGGSYTFAGVLLCCAGSTSSDDCISCQPGGADLDSNPLSPCESCPSGRYSDAVGSTECAGECESGEYSPPGSTDAAACSTCNPNKYDVGSCLYTFVPFSVSMLDAEAVCERAGGNLASINSDEDQVAVLAALGTSPGSSWIGLHIQFGTECADQSFLWTDGSNSTSGDEISELDWMDGEYGPNCAGIEQPCARMSTEGSLEIVECASTNTFVCQHCGVRTPAFEYEFFTDRITWVEAEDSCIQSGGHLASIHSEEQHALLSALGDTRGAWIGFHDRDVEAGCTGQGNNPSDHDTGFIWADGTPTDYTRWNAGEPNDWANNQANCDGTGNEDCGQMCPAARWCATGNWADGVCEDTSSYVCGYQYFTGEALLPGLPCYTCPAGFYLTDDSDPVCVSCASGTYSSPGSRFQDECVACEPGRADLDRSASTICTLCPAGYYSDSTGATECTAVCAPGSYADSGIGSTSLAGVSCIECSTGKADSDGNPSTPCQECPSGRYSDAVGVTECAGECLPTQYSPLGSADATACDSCNPVKYDASQCIYTVVPRTAPMLDAEAICNRAGGNLVSIHTDEHQAAILAAFETSTSSPIHTVWIGLHIQSGTDCADQNFLWTDGSDGDRSLTWVGGAADCSTAQQACCTMTSEGEIEIADCSLPNDFVCQHCGQRPPDSAFGKTISQQQSPCSCFVGTSWFTWVNRGTMIPK